MRLLIMGTGATMKGNSHWKKLKEVRARTTIITDGGKQLPFEGEIKAFYVKKYEEGLRNIVDYQIDFCSRAGRILSEARPKLKKYKLYNRFLKDLEISRSTAHNYVRLWETFGDNLSNYSHFSIRKLVVVAAKTDNPAQFCQDNESMIIESSLEKLRQYLHDNSKEKLVSNDNADTELFSTDDSVEHVEGMDRAESNYSSDINNTGEDACSTRWTSRGDDSIAGEQYSGQRNSLVGLLKTENIRLDSTENKRAKENPAIGPSRYMAYIGAIICVLIALTLSVDFFSKDSDAELDETLIEPAFNGDVVQVENGLNSGLDVDIRDSKKSTLLIISSANNHYRTAKLLLERGANPNARNSYGETALMYAALNGNHQIISLLLEKGAEINVKTKDNWTALARAKQGQHWKIYQTLARAGGRP